MASQPIGLQLPIRFGDDFELDVRTRRFRRGSHVLKLERIPLEILVLLLEHRGEIVTRDEIVAKVWGNSVFFDTDNSIRGAIRKVRQALKDDPENPRFIQTVTGQGIASLRQSLVRRKNTVRKLLTLNHQVSPIPRRTSSRSSMAGCKAADCV